MGIIKKPFKVKLISSIIFNNSDLLTSVEQKLINQFGDIDYKSKILDFQHTKYYYKEMGNELNRVFISFKRLIYPDDISTVKIFTNDIEADFLFDNHRSVNIDPGYLAKGKMVLATTKDYSHRVYLKDGIYAESTLHFFKGTFRPFTYTYPDYASQEVIDIFNNIRKLLVI